MTNPPRKGFRTCQTCQKNRALKFFVGASGRKCATCRRGRTRHTSRNIRLQNTYGITQSEYAILLSAQNGVCAGCLGTRKVLDVDHEHKAVREGVPVRQTIRGLLCAACNRRILRSAKDNPATLRRLADYLEDPPAQRVLG